MAKLIKEVTEIDGVKFTPTTTWFCDSNEDIANIPENVAAGSVAMILTNSGLSVKMKNSAGNWIEL